MQIGKQCPQCKHIVQSNSTKEQHTCPCGAITVTGLNSQTIILNHTQPKTIHIKGHKMKTAEQLLEEALWDGKIDSLTIRQERFQRGIGEPPNGVLYHIEVNTHNTQISRQSETKPKALKLVLRALRAMEIIT